MNINKPKYILAIASGKGGVGKSTVTTNLAVALKELGARVGVLDSDIYGPSQPAMLGEDAGSLEVNECEELIPCKRHGVEFVSMGLLLGEDSPVIWRAPMATKVIQQFLTGVSWGPLDFLLIDLPPGTGDVQLTLAQQASLTGAIIVSTPQKIAINIARKGLKMFEQVNVPILGIVENMSGFKCEHCGQETQLFPEGGAKVMAQNSHVPFLGKIPLDPQVMLCSDSGVPVLVDQPDSRASRAYQELALRLKEELNHLEERIKTPEPTQVEIQSDGSLSILWPDNHKGSHQPHTLRTQCACARCISEDTGERLLDPHSVSQDIQIKKALPVGRYALSLAFSDDHSSGIYAYDRLRALCECSACAKTLNPRPKANVSAPKDVCGKGLETPDAIAIKTLLKDDINPALATHGGHVQLVEIKDHIAFVQFSGGCQGCSMARETLKNGVEAQIREKIPQILEVRDITDHASGENPYLSSQG